jgi:hypothetical protein
MAISVKHPSVLGPDDPTKQVSKNVYEQEHDVTGVAESSALDVLSAQVVSADNAISAAVVALSAQHTSLAASVAGALSAITTNSAQMTSADDAISAAVVVLSARHTSLAASVAGALSAIGANSAQMTSADNAVSAAVAALSAQHTSLAASVAGHTSAIGVNSAQMTSADNAISAAVVALSAQHTSLADSVAGALSAIAANSAQMTSADDANSAAIAGILTSGQGPVRRILAGAQVVSATAPVSISGFTFTVSGGVGYRFEYGVFTSSPISLAGNKFVLSAPAGAIAGQIVLGGGAGISAANFDASNVTVAQVTVSAVGSPRANFIRGTFRPTANGTMSLAVGNNVSGAAAGSVVTVMIGSYGYVWRMG